MAGTDKKLEICLNMIVRDEAGVIERCIRSCLPMITSYCIVDTGSVDGTIETLQRFLPTTGLPGKLYTSTWKDFATNRNEALQLAKYPKVDVKTGKPAFPPPDFILFIDADEQFKYDDTFDIKNISTDYTSYYIGCHFAHVIYRRKLLIRANLDWYWFGVVHECVCCSQDDKKMTLPGVIDYPTNEGARSRNPHKYKLDANTIERDFIENPTARNCFYIAMCYKDDGDVEKASYWFKKRVAMKDSEEERFIAYMYLGKYYLLIKKKFEKATKYFFHALEVYPDRWEPLFELSSMYRITGFPQTALMFCKQANLNKVPEELLYIDKSVYAWKMFDEVAVTLFQTTRDIETVLALELKALNHPHTPETIDDASKKRIEDNVAKLQRVMAAVKAQQAQQSNQDDAVSPVAKE